MTAKSWTDNWTHERDLVPGGQGLTSVVIAKIDPTVRGVLKQLKNNKKHQARVRMRREVATLQDIGIHTENVPHVFDDNSDLVADLSAKMYVVTEYIPGQTLEERVKSGPMPLQEAAAVILSVAETVRIAHSLNVIHRDLHPKNVILREEDPTIAVVIDFGLAFNRDDEDATQDGEVFRNPFLDLPANVVPGGDRRDMRSDVVSLCALFHYMLTGKSPGHLQDDDGRVPHRRPGSEVAAFIESSAIARSVDAMLSRGFAVNSGDRFQTVEEFTSRLEIAVSAGSQSLSVNPIETARQASTEVRRRDRNTRLNTFTDNIQKVHTQFMLHVREHLEGRLEEFVLGGTDMVINAAPLGNHQQLGPSSAWQLRLQHGVAGRVFFLVFRCQGEECYAFYRTYFREKPDAEETPTIDWTVAACFPGDRGPVLSDLTQPFLKWLDDSIRDFVAELG